jgi:hypothetical protein
MDSVLKVLFILLLAISRQCLANELNKNNGIMIPNEKYQVVNASTNITITCMFIHGQGAGIDWELPKVPKTAVWKKKLFFTKYCS